MPAAYNGPGKRAWSVFRPLLVVAMVLQVSTGLQAEAEANGGALLFEGRAKEYMVSVRVNPPEPNPGLVLVGVVVQAVVSTNGAAAASLVNVAAELRVTATGPGPDGHVIGPFRPQPILPGISHFDIAMEVSHAGEWMLALEVIGPLGDVTVEVPFTVKDSGAAADGAGSEGRSPRPGWLLMTPLLVIAVLVIPLWLLRRRQGPPA